MTSLAAAIQAARWVSWSARQPAATRLRVIAHRQLGRRARVATRPDARLILAELAILRDVQTAFT